MKRTVLAFLLAGMAVAHAAPATDEDMGTRVQQLLREHQAAVFACVSKQTLPVEGEALLRVIVGNDQPLRVEVLKVEPTKPEVRAVADCVAADARTWHLGRLGAAEGDQVVFPLQFRPAPSTQSAAVAARMKRLDLARGGHEAERIEHPLALYVVTGSVDVRFQSDKQTGAAGDVLYFAGEGEMELSSQSGCELVRVESTAPAGPSLLELRKLQKTKAYTLPDGKSQVLLYLDGTSAPFAVDKLCAPRGADLPRHEHEHSDELVQILSGRAHATVGDNVTAQVPGDFIIIPRGTPHSLRVDDDLCAVQVYAPRGPEQRFKPSKPKGSP